MSQPKNIFSEFVEQRDKPKPTSYDPFNIGKVVDVQQDEKDDLKKRIIEDIVAGLKESENK
jgi:hypothetical protein